MLIKDINGYKGKYAITEDGRVFSYPRQGSSTHGLWKAACIDRNGYKTIGLMGKSYYIARLVAKTFIPNPENKAQVNHIDGDTLNNNVSNLEWNTPSENILHAYRTGLAKVNKTMLGKLGKDCPSSKPVLQYDLYGNLINNYSGASEASRMTKIDRSGISHCCKGKIKTAGGFIWKAA